MIISTNVTNPDKIMMPNGTSQFGRIRQIAFKVENDKDAEELTKIFAEGVDVIGVIGKYVFMKQFEQLKIQLPEDKA